jgi:transposase
MKRSIELNSEQRAELLDRYRKDHDPEVRFRSHILPLLDDGHSRVTVATILFCSSRTIDRWVKRFHAEGIRGVAGHQPGRPFRFAAGWVDVVVAWVTKHTPRDFGFLRSRWCCEAVVLLMLRTHQLAVSRETVRRWLHRGDLVYRRPRPILGPKDPERQARLDALRKILAELPADETAVFQDEVDINADPKIGSMWMIKGQQAKARDAGRQREAVHLRLDPLADRPGLPRRGQAEAGAEHRVVPGPPGRPAEAAAVLQEDPRDLRPGEVPHQRRGRGVPA